MRSFLDRYKRMAKQHMSPEMYLAVASMSHIPGHLQRRTRQRWKEVAWNYSPDGIWNRRQLRKLRDKYSGRRCFVLGNGPSLRKTDVRRLKDEVTIASNGIFLLFDYMGYVPTFYTIEDVLVAEDRAAEANKIKGTTKVFPHDVQHWLRPDKHTVYINFLRVYSGFPKFSDTFEDIVYFGGTVTFLNLQLAYHIGCREVYLIGFDHHYEVPSQTEATIAGNTITSHREDVNHFHPDYFGPGYRWHDPKVERMERAYHEAKQFFEAQGGIIHNATSGGKLEVFPRVDFDSLF
jgi:hypothetical protein